MDYIYQYNVAAIFVTSLVLFYFLLKKRISTRVSTAFVALSIDLLIAAITDNVTIWTIANPYKVPVWFNYGLNMICMFSYTFLPVLFYFCIFAATTSTKKRFILPEKHWLFTPIIIGTILIITTPINHYLIYFDENRIYHTGNLFYVLSLIGFVYLVLAIIRTIRKSYKLNRIQIITIISYTTGSIVALIIEAIDNRILIPLFFGSLTALLIYLSLDNPAEYVDSVTDIYNKKAFFEILNRRYVHNKSFKLIGFQIQNIQNINNTLGYTNCSKLLVVLTKKLSDFVSLKKIFKLSGNKFAILVDSEDDFETILQQVKTILDTPLSAPDLNLLLTYKLTFINCPKDAASTETAFDLIFHTLESPNTLPGVVTLADTRLLEKAKREEKLLTIMKDAIKNNKFYIVYQPIYSVKEKKYTSAEALIRLNNSDLGFISPEEFIPVAEKNGLMIDIGNYIFKEVCEYLALNKPWENGINFITLNLSVIQCMKEELLDSLLKTMDSYNLEHKYIQFEITDNTANMSNEILRKSMYKLMDDQVYFALDDNGYNMDSSAQLLKYPFKTFKLDKNIIWNAMQDERTMKVVHHTILMLKDLGLKIVAEGIETKEMADTLEKLECDYFQGYYYSKPIQAKELTQLITTKN